MKYDRFQQIWTALVTNRVPAAGMDAEQPCLNNGVSEAMADALIAVAGGDHSEFDEIQKKLSECDK